MASTNKTANLHLNQWEATDPVMREDFNADNAKLDAAFAELAATSKCRSGSYTGNGNVSQTISLGARPKAVFVLRNDGMLRSDDNDLWGGMAVTGSNCTLSTSLNVITLTNSGFTVYYNTSNSNNRVKTNSSNTTYHYIALL